MERSEILQKLIDELDGENLRLNVSTLSNDMGLVGDEIFHLPSISFCVLTLASVRHFKFKVPETGHFVASVLQETVSGIKSSQSDLRWSFRLRSVCADALDFLERAEMITIDSEKNVKIADKGKEFLSSSSQNDSALGLFRTGIIRGLDRAVAKGDRLL